MKKLFLMLSVSVLAATSFAATSFADGDADKGEKVFKKCKACHSVDQGGKHRVGPNLFNVFGAKAGHKDDYKYSPAMADSGLTWDEATLDAYLKSPKNVIKGTKMTFAGLKKDKQRANVIAYLKTLQ